MLAYGYCRYSSSLQDEKSIEQQKNELEEYARNNNISIIKYYIDEAKTGTKDSRDSFQNMISDACKLKEVQAILVWKTDRFARKAMDNLFYRNKLEKVGIRLISITQPIDTETPEGKLMSTMLAGMDEYYSQNLASNVKRALKLNAQNAQFNGGIAPLGYDIVDKKYVINEREASCVRLIYDMYIRGHSLVEIALKLNSMGFKTKKHKPFAKTSVYDIIGNEKYIGKYIFNKGTKSNHDGIRDDAIIIENAIPAIISKEVFKKAMNKRIKRNNAENTSKNFYLLSGLIKCSCGGSYIGTTIKKQKNGNTYISGYYRCSNHNKLGNCKMPSIKQDLIENKIIKILTEELLNAKTREKIIRTVNGQYLELQKDYKNNVDILKQNLANINKEIDNIVDAVAQGHATNSLLERLEKIENVKKDIEEEIDFKNNIVTHDYITADKIEGMLKKDLSELKNRSKEKLKLLVQKYVKKIEVKTTELLVYLDFGEISPKKLVATTRYSFCLRININDFIAKRK